MIDEIIRMLGSLALMGISIMILIFILLFVVIL